MMNGGNTGVAMLLRSVGLDPALLIAKGEEFERLAKAVLIEVNEKVISIDTRLARMEMVLARIEASQARTESAAAGVSPAGETVLDLALLTDGKEV